MCTIFCLISLLLVENQIEIKSRPLDILQQQGVVGIFLTKPLNLFDRSFGTKIVNHELIKFGGKSQLFGLSRFSAQKWALIVNFSSKFRYYFVNVALILPI